MSRLRPCLPAVLLAALVAACAARAALVNLAPTGTASASGAGFGSVAADGNDGNRDGLYANGSVFHTPDPDSTCAWEFTLPSARTLDHLRLFNRRDTIQGSVNNFRIRVFNGAAEVFNQVFLPTSAADSNSSVFWGTDDVRGLTATRVRLERVSPTVAPRFITFAELEAWGVNGALDPLIAPASVTASAAAAGCVAADANDGDIHGNFNAPGAPVYVSATAGIGQFWQMTFATDYRVKSLLFFNRSDAATTGLVKVSLRNAAGVEVWSQNQSLSPGTSTAPTYGFELLPDLGARSVRVETLSAEPLALAEVQAFGVPLVVTAPSVDNQTPQDVTAVSATLRGIVTATGFEAPSCRVYFGPTDGGTNAAAWAGFASAGIQSGAFSTPVTGLSPQTPYFARAFAQNSGGTAWAGSTLTFTTPALVPAAAEMLPVSGLSARTALLAGRVTDTGNGTPSAWIYYGTTDGGTNAAAWASAVAFGPQTGVFQQYLNNLSPQTSYFARAAVSNAAGRVWSPNTIVFATTDRPAVVVNELHVEPVDNTVNLEFIELHNPSAVAVDLSGWRLLGDASHVFAPGFTVPAGGYRVLAANASAFQTYYGFAPDAVYAGDLGNNGGEVELRDAGNAVVDIVTYGAGFPWPTAAAGAGPSMELLHPALDNDKGGAWRSSTQPVGQPKPQTPRAVNSVLSLVAPPLVRGVEHLPAVPVAGQPVVITARVDDAQGVASVTLSLQTVDPGAYIRRTDAGYATAWTTLAMTDDGLGGDTVAGDGTWTATVPGATQTHRRLVRYRITATDLGGATVTAPLPDDEQPNFAYFCYNGLPAWTGAFQPAAGVAGFPQTPAVTFPSTLVDDIPAWHLIANATDVNNCQYNGTYNNQRFLGTLVHEGRVYDHIQYRNRGIGSTYVSGKNKWALYFNRARNIRIRDNWGRYFDQSWNSLPIDACASPWAPVHRGMAGVEEAVSYRLHELAGTPGLRTTHLQWRVIDGAAESNPADQYDNDLWGLYMALEPTEGNLLQERGLPDGNIYAVEGGGGDKKHQGASQSADNSDWNTFYAGANQAGQTEAWYRANLDLPSLFNFHAVGRYCGNIDVRAGDNYRYWHRSSDNRWVLMAYDLDMQFIPAHHWGADIDGVTYAGVTAQFRAITRHPAIALEFRNHARGLLDLLGEDAGPAGGQIGQLIDEYARLVNPAGGGPTWALLDAHRWNASPQSSGSGAPSGQTGHRYNFWRTPFQDARGANMAGADMLRTLPDPDGNGYGDFAGSMAYLLSYGTATFPTGSTWARDNGNPLGYGYKYLEWESLYGGLGLNPSAPDLSFPNRPTAAYAGPPGYPVNALDFTSGPFSPSASGGTTFAGLQWRIGEIYAPGIAAYVAGDPCRYEIEEVWNSGVRTGIGAAVRVPVSVCRPGHTYRARVRHLDANGRWSRWSPAVTFTPSAPDVSVYQSSLVISEVHYNPPAVTPAEALAGFGSDDFEWLEFKNVGALPLDLTGVRLTKGVDFDFPDGYSLPAGGFALVVSTNTAFRLRHGTSHDAILAGNFAPDRLANGGEEIKLSYGAGTEILSFTYDNIAPWPVAADGGGYTLTLINPGIVPDPKPASQWRASRVPGGTPGADDLITYALWTNNYPGVTGPAGDDDFDGLSNRLEYAHNRHPLVADATPPPVTHALAPLVVSGSTNRYLTLQFHRRVDAADLAYEVSASPVLPGAFTGTPVRVLSQPVGDGVFEEQWRSPVPMEAVERDYLRLRVLGSP